MTERVASVFGLSAGQRGWDADAEGEDEFVYSPRLSMLVVPTAWLLLKRGQSMR